MVDDARDAPTRSDLRWTAVACVAHIDECPRCAAMIVEPESRRGYLLEALGEESLGGKRKRVRLRSTPLTRG